MERGVEVFSIPRSLRSSYLLMLEEFRMKKLLALLAVLGMVNAASAAVTWDYQVNPDSDGWLKSVEGYDSYVFNIYVSDADVVRAFDLIVDTNGVPGIRQSEYVADARTGEMGVNFSLNTSGSGPFAGTTLGLNANALSQMATGKLVQNAVGTVDGFADSSYIRYAVGIPDGTLYPNGWTSALNNDQINYPQQAGMYTIGIVYLKQGVTADVYYAAAAGTSGEGLFFEKSFTIPEPATLGLLAMGVVGLLRRKLA
jgi:hypothetical protein